MHIKNRHVNARPEFYGTTFLGTDKQSMT